MKEEQQGKEEKAASNSDGNPFRIAPNKYTRGILKVVEPFLVINRSGRMPEFDEFQAKMNKSALSCAVTSMARELTRVQSIMRVDKNTELAIRPLHQALVFAIGAFAKPSEDEISDLNDYFEYAPQVEIEDEESLSAYLVSSGGCEAKNPSLHGSGPSVEGFKVDHECAPQGEDDVKQPGRTDFRVFVHDKSPLKIKVPWSQLAEVKIERLVAIIESKFDREIDGIFQAVGYARSEILRNLQNLHFKPVYVLVFSESNWTYGILDVRGSIRIKKNNTIDKISYEGLLVSEKLYFHGEEYVPTKEEDLQSELNRKVELLQEKYNMKAYPKRKYLVGTLHLSEKWYDLPSASKDGGLSSPDALRFFEGLLRMAIGSRINHWTIEDVQAAYNRRMELIDLQSKYKACRGLVWEPASKRAKQ